MKKLALLIPFLVLAGGYLFLQVRKAEFPDAFNDRPGAVFQPVTAGRPERVVFSRRPFRKGQGRDGVLTQLAGEVEKRLRSTNPADHAQRPDFAINCSPAPCMSNPKPTRLLPPA